MIKKNIKLHKPSENVTITFGEPTRIYAVAQEVLRRYQEKIESEEFEIIGTPDRMEGYSILSKTTGHQVADFVKVNESQVFIEVYRDGLNLVDLFQ